MVLNCIVLVVKKDILLLNYYNTMSLSLKNIKRWYLMLTGQSIYHVNQSLGLYFSEKCIRGYYNNMMQKVLMDSKYVYSDLMPSLDLENGQKFFFPVGIFQYAFGLLDLYYESNNELYLSKFRQCSDWAFCNQLESGAWDNFSYYYPTHPYGAMAQGEGASLLLRAYVLFGEVRYLSAAQRAIDFMLKSNKDGGCTGYDDNNGILLLEYPHRKAVMNGFIFSWWGLYDYVLVTGDEGHYRQVMNQSLDTLVKLLPKFSSPYWSQYDLEGRIASPFYHNLHIAQMQAMYQLTGVQIFDDYAKRWARQQKNPLCKGLAFLRKSIQKILE